MEKTLIAVVGPTAIGKTALAISLAKHFQTEIISADSRQFYKEMSIGTAVPSHGELKEVKHHFIQHLSIAEPWSVGDFEKAAMALLDELFQTHDLIVVVGGSGLYIQALAEGLDHFPDVQPNVRQNLNQKYAEEGISYLQSRLQKIDPVYHKQVDLQNPHRLIRAIEVYESSGKPYSSFLKRSRKKRSFRTIYIGLNTDRKVLYQRIEERVDSMMQAGLLEEARKLIEFKNLGPLQTVGYQELFEHIEDHCSLEAAVLEIKKNTRRYAKRQLTWYRKNEQINWVEFNMPVEEIIRRVELQLKSETGESDE